MESPTPQQLRAIWSLAAKFQKAFSQLDLAGEIALLLAWKQRSMEHPAGQFPRPADVVSGLISLEEAYRQLHQYARGNQGFVLSRLPLSLSANEARELCADIEQFNLQNLRGFLNYCFAEPTLNRYTYRLALPEEVVNLMLDLVELHGRELYAPYEPSFPLALAACGMASKITYTAQGTDLLTEAALLVSPIDRTYTDPLSAALTSAQALINTAERVLVAPPFGRTIQSDANRTQRMEVVALQHCVARCSGKLVALVPVGLLFRGGDDYYFRQQLIQNGKLHTVIQFPPYLLANSPVSTALLVIDKTQSTQQVKMIDATASEFIETQRRGKPPQLKGHAVIAMLANSNNPHASKTLVHATEIIENDFDLSIGRYVVGAAGATLNKLHRQNTNYTTLSEVAEIIRGQLLKEDPGKDPSVVLEVGVRDLNENGLVNEPAKKLAVSGMMQDRARIQKLQPNDILLVTKGSVGKVGFVDASCGDDWVASQSFLILRIKDPHKVLPEYLYMFLSSTLMTQWFAEQVTGTTIPMLKSSDLRNLTVPLAPMEEQMAVRESFQAILSSHAEIDNIRRRITELKNRHWPL